MSDKRAIPGRPPREGGARRDVIVTLDDDERALIDAACKATGQVRAVAIREAALRWAKRVVSQGPSQGARRARRPTTPKT